MPTPRNVIRAALVSALSLAGPLTAAHAQSTLVLSAPGTEVTDDATIQAGAGADTNFARLDWIATKAGLTDDDLLRALVKFDTQYTLPAGAPIQSAVLTLTIMSAGADPTRTIGVYPVTLSFLQDDATWNARRGDYAWTTAGGDLGVLSTTQSVPNVVGTKVAFDITNIVATAVSGANGSRYTRIALVDLDAASASSERRFYSMEAADPSVRPLLTIVYGGAARAVSTEVSTNVSAEVSTDVSGEVSAVSPAVSTGSTQTLRVLQYNTHHGGWGTDGVFSTARILDWILKANPDIVSLQELEINDGWSNGLDLRDVYRSAMEQATGRPWHAYWVSRYGGTTTTSGLGELILSKYPFIATHAKSVDGDRSAAGVTIDVNGRPINITSVHLDNESSTNRLTEIEALLAWETTLAEGRIIVGDLNAWPGSTEIAKIKEAGYTDTFSAADMLGTAVGNGITHGRHQIDYIFQSKGATALTLKSSTIYNTADANGVMPSDHNPILAVFEVK
jgi:endonuclease/exonuclease/phosphatase family metal-dependent hydrolase